MKINFRILLNHTFINDHGPCKIDGDKLCNSPNIYLRPRLDKTPWITKATYTIIAEK